VLTAFVVESYQSLQENYAETTVLLLRQISRQLADPSLPPAPDFPEEFRAQTSDIQVNICWLLSLLLSLLAAFFGILFKQWIRTYIKWTGVIPEREAVILRQYRYENLESWKLGMILTMLPVLLQVSVILFVIGLLDFMWNINFAVGKIITVFGVLGLTVVTAVTVFPLFSETCPYRSPLPELLLGISSNVSHYFRHGSFHVYRCLRTATCLLVPRRLPDSDLEPNPISRSHEPLPYVVSKTMASSWNKVDAEGIKAHGKSGSIPISVEALRYLCCTTRSEDIWTKALTRLVGEYGASDFAPADVWWSIICHIFGNNTRKAMLTWERCDRYLLSLTQHSQFQDALRQFCMQSYLQTRPEDLQPDYVFTITMILVQLIGKTNSGTIQGGHLQDVSYILAGKLQLISEFHVHDITVCLHHILTGADSGSVVWTASSEFHIFVSMMHSPSC
jgi:hypothetical protein